MNAANDLQDTFSPATPQFSIGTILFFMPHLTLNKKPGKIVDVTSGVLFPNTLSPKNLVAAAQKAFDELPPDAAGIEHYRVEKSGVKNFTIFADPSDTVLARFDAPIFAWHSISISFPPVPGVLSPASAQQTVDLKMSSAFSRSHNFIYHSRTYVWNFDSGTKIRLQATRSGGGGGGDKTDLITLAAFWFADKWFASRGVLALADRAEDQTAAAERGPEWEKVVVVTLLACLRREREMRYNLAGHGIPVPRTLR
ncbi:hypothetical protein MMC07_001657 [Pseudocyphellaria aurata]|nr:hypothetical protein [Pseudocyphellaria aurata]